jgi:DUF4097 and DUF4098 domain-containing protein YvlB
MKTIFAVRGVLATSLVGALAATAGAADFQWQGRAGQTLEVKGVNGRITASPADGGEAQVTAIKKGRRSDPESVRVEVVEHAGGVTICAVYPTPYGKRKNECLPGSEGHMSTQDNDVSVDFEVRVPSSARFVARTVNGGVEVDGLENDVEAYTVNGGVNVETRGNARAETVNGSIVASAGRADWTGTCDFKTVNGSVTVSLPDDTSADVKASTVNGGIETDFPLEVKGRFQSRRLSGRLGGGGRALHLETVNGGIRLRRTS